MAWVYILKSIKKSSYYIGSTNDKERRFAEHFLGKSKYTSPLRPLKVVFTKEYQTLIEARKIEAKLKKLKSRKIIEEILEEGYIKLRR